MEIEKTAKVFGSMPDGTEIEKFTIGSSHGTKFSVITYGGIITDFSVPDRNDQTANIVLDFSSLEGYFAKSLYFGAIIGVLPTGAREVDLFWIVRGIPCPVKTPSVPVKIWFSRVLLISEHPLSSHIILRIS